MYLKFKLCQCQKELKDKVILMNCLNNTFYLLLTSYSSKKTNIYRISVIFTKQGKISLTISRKRKLLQDKCCWASELIGDPSKKWICNVQFLLLAYTHVIIFRDQTKRITLYMTQIKAWNLPQGKAKSLFFLPHTWHICFIIQTLDYLNK